MIKELIVNLTVGADRDVAANYAISVASTFGGHLSGIGFAYEAVVPGMLRGPTGECNVRLTYLNLAVLAADIVHTIHSCSREVFGRISFQCPMRR
jgi:hypothetical protein